MQPRSRVASLLSSEFIIPVRTKQVWKRERSQLQQVLLAILISINNLLNLLSYFQKRPNIAIQLINVLRFSRLNHYASWDREGNSWSVVAVVH